MQRQRRNAQAKGLNWKVRQEIVSTSSSSSSSSCGCQRQMTSDAFRGTRIQDAAAFVLCCTSGSCTPSLTGKHQPCGVPPALARRSRDGQEEAATFQMRFVVGRKTENFAVVADSGGALTFDLVEIKGTNRLRCSCLHGNRTRGVSLRVVGAELRWRCVPSERKMNALKIKEKKKKERLKEEQRPASKDLKQSSPRRREIKTATQMTH